MSRDWLVHGQKITSLVESKAWAKAPIVPVAIQGGRAAMRKGSKIVWPVTVTIRVGQPIETTGIELKDREALIARVRDRIVQLVAAGPIEPLG